MTNPLSVKTKVHLPRSPSALLSRDEREKVFLEVHIQNLTQDALWFQRIGFECVDGWDVEDINTTGVSSQDGLFLDDNALMQPQDMRQYIYILAPKVLPDLPVTHPPGSVISLGRLDIAWRSSFGEPGRLLTSVRERPADGWKRVDCILDAISTDTVDSSDHSGIGTTATHAEERIAGREQHATEVSFTSTFVSTTDATIAGQSALTCTVRPESEPHWDNADVSAYVGVATAGSAKRISGFSGD